MTPEQEKRFGRLFPDEKRIRDATQRILEVSAELHLTWREFEKAVERVKDHACVAAPTDHSDKADKPEPPTTRHNLDFHQQVFRHFGLDLLAMKPACEKDGSALDWGIAAADKAKEAITINSILGSGKERRRTTIDYDPDYAYVLVRWEYDDPNTKKSCSTTADRTDEHEALIREYERRIAKLKSGASPSEVV